ncbi:MAG: hypothetical protein U0586_01840 [Candidatus Brocadiaceae bacterium]
MPAEMYEEKPPWWMITLNNHWTVGLLKSDTPLTLKDYPEKYLKMFSWENSLLNTI